MFAPSPLFSWLRLSLEPDTHLNFTKRKYLFQEFFPFHNSTQNFATQRICGLSCGSFLNTFATLSSWSFPNDSMRPSFPTQNYVTGLCRVKSITVVRAPLACSRGTCWSGTIGLTWNHRVANITLEVNETQIVRAITPSSATTILSRRYGIVRVSQSRIRPIYSFAHLPFFISPF